ncbi:MAG: hypothetical protein EXS14_06120 [Planctomycetes bacterium]|nr:hypothetical protein [Planctomycetota bacterium]
MLPINTMPTKNHEAAFTLLRITISWKTGFRWDPEAEKASGRALFQQGPLCVALYAKRVPPSRLREFSVFLPYGDQLPS